MEQFGLVNKEVMQIRNEYCIERACLRLNCNKAGLAEHIVKTDDTRAFTSKRTCSKKIYRYVNEGGNIKDKQLILAVNALCPGTMRLYNHPLWVLLSASDICQQQLIVLAQQLDPELCNCLLDYDSASGDIQLHLLNTDKRHQHFMSLSRDKQNIELLSAYLIWIRAHDISGKRYYSLQLQRTLQPFLVSLSLAPEYRKLSLNIYDIVDDMYIWGSHWNSNCRTINALRHQWLKPAYEYKSSIEYVNRRKITRNNFPVAH